MLVFTVPLLSDKPVTTGVVHVQNLKLNLVGSPPVGSGTEQFDNGVESPEHPPDDAIGAVMKPCQTKQAKIHMKYKGDYWKCITFCDVFF